MYSETDFESEKKSIGSIIFRLKLKHESMYFWTAGWGGGVNIFLPVFKPLKFSLQYEILNLEWFLQINGANYALVVDNTNFHFHPILEQKRVIDLIPCHIMSKNMDQNLNLLQNKLFWLNNKWVLKDEYFIRFTLRCIHAVLDIPLKCPKKWISLPIDISK